jgi:hypothetical protein
MMMQIFIDEKDGLELQLGIDQAPAAAAAEQWN